MKIRNHRKLEYWFFPSEDSKLQTRTFKYKSYLMNFLSCNFFEALNGKVRLHEKSFGRSGDLRAWDVWFNQYQNSKGAYPKIELRVLNFRGKKYYHKPFKISKADKKYFAFSDKVINLMCNIQDDNGNILSKDAKRLVDLFKKRGFNDFIPSEEDLEYINGHISKGIDFFHWSDRCNTLRMKTIIEYFKRNNIYQTT